MPSNNEIINEVVDPKVITDFKAAQQAAKELGAEFVTLTKNAAAALAATGNAKNLRELNRELQQSAILTERLQQQQAKTAQANTNAAAATLRYEQAQQRATQTTAKLTDQYGTLTTIINEAERAALNIGVAFGKTSTQFQNASKRVSELREQQNQLRRSTGDFRGDVGNYEKGFRGLGNSINQITREFPAFANSVQTGFLAISNNLPIFFDELSRVRQEINLIRESGQKAPTMFQAFTRSLFTWGTALSFGVTLLTVFGAQLVDYIGSLFKGKDALDQFAERQRALNEVYRQSNIDAAKQITNLKYLYEAATDVNNSMVERKKAVDELQNQFPGHLGNIKDETILIGGAKDAYNELTKSIIIQARARAAADEIAKISAKIFDADIKIQKIRNAEINETRRNDEDVKKRIRGALDFEAQRRGKERASEYVIAAETKRIQEGQTDEVLKGIKKRAKAAIDEQENIKRNYQATIGVIEQVVGGSTTIGNALADEGQDGKKGATEKQKKTLDERLQNLRDNLQLVLDDETRSYEDRLAAIYVFERESERLILEAQRKKEITQLVSSNKSAKIERDGAKEREKIQEELNRRAEELRKQELARLQAGERAKLEEIQTALNERLRLIDRERTDYLTSINEQYTQGLISTRQYNQQVLAIEKATTEKRIEAQLAAARAQVETLAAANALGFGDPKELQSATDNLLKIQKDASDYITKVQLDNIDKLKQARQELASIERQSIDQAAQLISTVVDTVYRDQFDALAAQGEQLNNNARVESEAIQRSLDTNENKAARQRVLDAQQMAQREQLAEREKQLQKEQARTQAIVAEAVIIANAAQAIFNVQAKAAEATAQGALLLANPLTAAYAPIAFAAAATIQAQIPFIVGFAVAQAAATAIPAFAKGTNYHKGGLAQVGEEGRELIETPDGGTYLSPATATILDLPRGSKVKTASQTRSIIRPEVLRDKTNTTVNVKLNDDRIVKAIEKNAPKKSRVSDWRNDERRAEFRGYRDRRFR
jgi:hypothetical protein